MQQSLLDWDLVCPDCRSELSRPAQSFVCTNCGREYPIIFDIPDFRLTSDRYLDLDAERQKARRLAKKAETCSFEELLAFYYSITGDVPDDLAASYMRAIANGPDHFEHIADEIASSYPERILDAGCGSGSLLVALGHRQRKALGVDIALRWLVISRKRLMEAGIEPQLICADMLRPPLRAESASAIVAFDLVEHTGDIDQTARSIASLMRPGGMAWVSAPNRFTLGPHPSVRLWGIGFLPIRAARSVCRWLKGADSLRFVEFTTPAKVADALIRAGLTVNSINPRKLSDVFRENYSGLDNLLIRAYRRLCRTRLGSRLLVWIGPIAEIRATSPGTPTE